ncbi:MAG: cytochrome c-type biogenesis protein CcmH [Acidobacteriota bacterium]|nr:cytochrome c-type biogenesis protein CcmH [Acidobacteriota bacterium]MDH3522965.1 cytochrome c-type biogenesis protein CcmH [Acidobacteriota bacterium]
MPRAGRARAARRRAAAAALLALLAALGATAARGQAGGLDEDERRELGPAQGAPVSGALLDARAYEIGSLLRCPVCQGLSVADSPVDAAVSMQAKIRRLVAAGYSEEQILAYFEGSYGEFIRLSPKPEGFNLVVWILPVVAVLVGLGIVARRVRAVARPAAAGEDLEAYRRKVREAVEE